MKEHVASVTNLCDGESLVEITQCVQLPLLPLDRDVELADTLQCQLLLFHQDTDRVSHEPCCHLQHFNRYGGREQVNLWDIYGCRRQKRTREKLRLSFYYRHSFKSHTVWYSVRPSTHTSRITKSHHLGREGREAPSTDTMLPCLFSVVPNSRDPAIVERLLLHSSGHVLTLFCWLAKFK